MYIGVLVELYVSVYGCLLACMRDMYFTCVLAKEGCVCVGGWVRKKTRQVVYVAGN